MVDQLKWNKIGVFALKLSEIIEIAENYRRLRRISHIHNFLSECQRLSLLLSGSQLFKTSITVFDKETDSTMKSGNDWKHWETDKSNFGSTKLAKNSFENNVDLLLVGSSGHITCS